MAYDQGAPFGRGQAVEASDDLVQYEGKEFTFNDVHPGTNVKYSSMKVICRLVKNNAAIAVLPKRIVKYELGADDGRQVNGYTTTTAERAAGIVDEYLPAAGAAVGYYFWVVVKGPSTFLTDIAALTTGTVVLAGDNIVALTGATSGATTSGRGKVPEYLTSNSTGVALADQVANRIGVAMSSATTGQTNTGVRINVRHW